MSTQIDLGPVLSVPKGNWNAETTYEKLNLVRHNSAAWICNVATSTGVEPTTDSTDWYLLVEDTSGVSSVNGMKGDVVININEAETPDEDDNSTRIATTEWVTVKLDAATMAYLLLSGGTMTGPIISSGYAMRYPSNEFISARSTSGHEGGASWVAYGKNHLSRPGEFSFTAHDGTNSSYVQLLPSGKFNINGINIVRSVNGTNADINGNVTLTKQDIIDSLGYTPPTTDTNTTYTNGTGIALSGTTFSLATIVTAGNAGPTANASPAHGGTFTVPYITYNAYGQVTGRTNRTITLPAAPTTKGAIGSAWASNSTSMTLPSGGTWFVFNTHAENGSDSYNQWKSGVSTKSNSLTNFAQFGGTFSGGTTVYAIYHKSGENGSTAVSRGKLCAVRIS